MKYTIKLYELMVVMSLLVISGMSMAASCDYLSQPVESRDNIIVAIEHVTVQSGEGLYDNGRMTKPVRIDYQAKYLYDEDNGSPLYCTTTLTEEEFKKWVHLSQYQEFATPENILDLSVISSGFLYTPSPMRGGIEYSHDLTTLGPSRKKHLDNEALSEPRQNLNTMWVSYSRFIDDSWIGYPNIALCAYSEKSDGTTDKSNCLNSTSNQLGAEDPARQMIVLSGIYDIQDIGLSERSQLLCNSKAECKKYTTDSKGIEPVFSADTVKRINISLTDISPSLLKANSFDLPTTGVVSFNFGCIYPNQGTGTFCTDKKDDDLNAFYLIPKHTPTTSKLKIIILSNDDINSDRLSIEPPLTFPINTTLSLAQTSMKIDAEMWEPFFPSGTLGPDGSVPSYDSKPYVMSTILDDYGNKVILGVSFNSAAHIPPRPHYPYLNQVVIDNGDVQ